MQMIENILEDSSQSNASSHINNNKQIFLHTEGSHSCRYNSICFANDNIIVYPCGVYLNKFDYLKDAIIASLSIDKSIIFNVQKFSENLIIAFCYNGKGAIISINDFKIIKRVNFENGNTISNVSFSADLKFITVSCEYYIDIATNKILEGASAVFYNKVSKKKGNNLNKNNSSNYSNYHCNIKSNANDLKEMNYEDVKIIKKRDCLTEINSENNLFLIEKIFYVTEADKNDSEWEKYSNSNFYFEMKLFNLPEYIIALEDLSLTKKTDKEKKVAKPKLKNYLLKSSEISRNEQIVFLLRTESRKYIGISFAKRNLLLLDIGNLSQILHISFEGKGSLGAMDLLNKEYCLYFTNQTKTLSKICFLPFINFYENQSQKLSQNKEHFNINNCINKIYVKLNNEIQLNFHYKHIEIHNGNTIKVGIENPDIKSEINFNLSIVNEIEHNNYINTLNHCLRTSPNGEAFCWVNEKGFSVLSKYVNNKTEKFMHCYLNKAENNIQQTGDLFCKGNFVCRNSKIKMTGVGLSINKKANLFAVGDLEGNINIFSLHEDGLNLLSHLSTLKINDAIRCLEWSDDDNLYIGCMSGELYEAKKILINSKSNNPSNVNFEFELTLLENFKRTITCIRVFAFVDENLDLKNFIFLSQVNGSINILLIVRNEVRKLHEFIAHPPQPENKDMRFGSLCLNAEIWSISVFPKFQNTSEKKLLITLVSASEDQTIKIFELNLFDFFEMSYNKPMQKSQLIDEIKTFKNHELAVTSVDLKHISLVKPVKQVLLASCSDDKIINLYNFENNEFSLKQVLTTQNHVFGWHTITYLSLEEDGHRLAVVTQNGFLVIYSLIDYSILFCEKIHLGGIEGLAWKNNTIITCSSDLNLGVIKL